MKIAAILVLFALGICLSGAASMQNSSTDSRAEVVSSFGVTEVWLDAGNGHLGSWQVELVAASPSTRVVGIEGGDAGVFGAPPHYDPDAMQRDRVILGAYAALPEAQLPTGRVLVARVHFMAHGTANPDWTATVMTAGGASGERIEASVTVRQAK